MSDCWFNLRVWCFHLQIKDGSRIPRLSFNDYHWPWPKNGFFMLDIRRDK